MNWCKLGFHDWEILERITEVQLISNIKHHQRYLEDCKKITDGRPMPPESPPCRLIKDPIDFDKRYIKKICLRCGKKIDEITPLKKKLELDIEREKQEVPRKERAMVLWNSI
jgi:hypothetical protein